MASFGGLQFLGYSKLWPLLLLVITLTELCYGQCPDGYQSSGGMCMYMSTNRVPWQNAMDTCAQQDATLFHVKKNEDWAMIVQNVPQQQLTNIWIGLHYDPSTGTYTWSDGTTYNPATDWAPWGSNQPNVAAGQCVSPKYDIKLKVVAWFMTSCGNTLSPICVKPQVTTVGTGTPYTFPSFEPVTCPPGFSTFGGQCMTYQQDPVTYQDAMVSCAENNSHVLFTKEEWLWRYAEYFIGSQLPNFWVGLSYNQATQQFEWADGSTYNPATDWSAWCPGQPGTPGQWAGDCVNTMQDYESGHYCWYMSDCNQGLYAVCLLDLPTTTAPLTSTIATTTTLAEALTTTTVSTVEAPTTVIYVYPEPPSSAPPAMTSASAEPAASPSTMNQEQSTGTTASAAGQTASSMASSQQPPASISVASPVASTAAPSSAGLPSAQPSSGPMPSQSAGSPTSAQPSAGSSPSQASVGLSSAQPSAAPSSAQPAAGPSSAQPPAQASSPATGSGSVSQSSAGMTAAPLTATPPHPSNLTPAASQALTSSKASSAGMASAPTGSPPSSGSASAPTPPGIPPTGSPAPASTVPLAPSSAAVPAANTGSTVSNSLQPSASASLAGSKPSQPQTATATNAPTSVSAQNPASALSSSSPSAATNRPAGSSLQPAAPTASTSHNVSSAAASQSGTAPSRTTGQNLPTATSPSASSAQPHCNQKQVGNFLPALTNGYLTYKPFKILQNTNSVECATACLREMECASFDWNAQTGECHLLMEKYTDDCVHFVTNATYQHYDLVTTDKSCYC